MDEELELGNPAQVRQLARLNINEIELKKWCLELIAREYSFEDVDDMVASAEKLLAFVRSDVPKSASEDVGFVKYPLKAYPHQMGDSETCDDDLVHLDWSARREKDGELPLGPSSEGEGLSMTYHYKCGKYGSRISFNFTSEDLWIDVYSPSAHTIPLDDPLAKALIMGLGFFKGESND